MSEEHLRTGKVSFDIEQAMQFLVDSQQEWMHGDYEIQRDVGHIIFISDIPTMISGTVVEEISRVVKRIGFHYWISIDNGRVVVRIAGLNV